MFTSPSHPLSVLIILDGFGYNENKEGNAIVAAKTPMLDWLWSNFPHTLIKAAEEEVGLSFGQIGNSEVGHMAIGTGRVIPSPLSRINAAIENQSFFTNNAFLAAIAHVRIHHSRLHVIGMISSAGVHADLGHIRALLELAKREHIQSVFVHAILDGRDTGPQEATEYLTMLGADIKRIGVGTIASLGGRAYAMDRNNNWAQTEKYYAVLAGLSPVANDDARAILKRSYVQGLDDESISPTLLDPIGKLANDDAVIMANFREDRVRQLAHVLSDQQFSPFPRHNYPTNLFVVTMTEYEQGLPVAVAFPKVPVTQTLSDVLELHGWRQLHISETEKYAHVTYFFNGGREVRLPHEEYVNIPSDTPDLFLTHPNMQAEKIAMHVVDDIRRGAHDFLIINFANPDMVGHTGNLEQTIRAIEAVDTAVGHIVTAVLERGGFVFLTADHGNAELKIDLLTKKNSKDHTINPVPFLVAANHLKLPPSDSESRRITYGSQVTGILQDVAPTILATLGLPIPGEMTGVPALRM